MVTTNDVSTEEMQAILTERPIEMTFALNVSSIIIVSYGPQTVLIIEVSLFSGAPANMGTLKIGWPNNHKPVNKDSSVTRTFL